MIQAADRVPVVESGLKRAASILLIIGMASALSAFLTQILSLERLFGGVEGIGAIVSLFCLAALLKLIQGSSMATFAAVGPLALPLVAASGLPPSFAVLAICLGSFIAILPNDSFYWLLKDTAFQGTMAKEARVAATLGGGACLQALTGLAVVIALFLVIH
jgi:GntP family gluconate:H+ symporter